MDGMYLGSGEGREYDGGELPVELPGHRILPGEPEQWGVGWHGGMVWYTDSSVVGYGMTMHL